MDRIEQRILQIIENHKEEIISIGRDVYDHAEMGFREYRTAGLVKGYLEQLGMICEDGLAVTGVKGYLKRSDKKETERPCTVALIGEMDGLPMDAHSHANPETGASHCCGHNAQIAGLIGAAIALADEEVHAYLDGTVVFMAVPSEEYVDVEFKNELMKQNRIRYGGGKSELIRIGAFDDIDVAVGHHIVPEVKGYILANGTTNGFLNKIVRFHGKSAHAAAYPEQGIDALNAAVLAMHAVDLQRETFQDQDSVRIHSYLPRAGEAVNIVAEETCMESSIRAKNVAAIQDASRKYDRSMRAGAVAMGCSAEIITVPGYLPTVPVEDPGLMEETLLELSEESRKAGNSYPVEYRAAQFHEAGSTDFGEVSSLLPLYQFRTGGYSGELHNTNIAVSDEQLAYVETAKVFALMAYKLLKDQAEAARRVMKEFQPVMTKEEYFAYMEEMNRVERVDGTGFCTKEV